MTKFLERDPDSSATITLSLRDYQEKCAKINELEMMNSFYEHAVLDIVERSGSLTRKVKERFGLK